ncbi:MAG TPA: glycosyltransferase family 2 protein, partial [Candidatus Acidoferrum sp.]|nr:glycosyltransferase family 2 protein [Candidatus Acidoferrum sp.]
HHLRVCLPSLRSQSFKLLEIIVVDNGSSDDSAEAARELKVRWLGLDENIGRAPALNQGAAIAAGDFLLFVNNDMRFDREFVAALVEPLLKDDEIFSTDGMQYNWEGTVPGHLAARLTRVRSNGQSFAELVPGLYFFQEPSAAATPVFMGSAASMMVRRTHFENLRGFDDRLPLGYEDVELCWRAWIRGWKTVFIPNAICWHRVGSSGRSPEGTRLNFRGILKGRLLLAIKLLPLRYAVRTWLVSKLGLGKDLFRLRLRFALDRMGVLMEIAGLIPQLRRERKMLFGNARSSPEKQLGVLLQLKEGAGFQADGCEGGHR